MLVHGGPSWQRGIAIFVYVFVYVYVYVHLFVLHMYMYMYDKGPLCGPYPFSDRSHLSESDLPNQI